MKAEFLNLTCGLCLVLGGCWLSFDVASTLSVHPLSESHWQFCLPFFLACLDSGHWTFAFDISVAMILSGALIMRTRSSLVRGGFHLRMKAKEVICTVVVALTVGAALTLLLISVDPLKLLLG
ncbi:hypothetical protein MUP07_00860 [Candidatus Bathyarchaeota archaeon]|nr:hypothetical protein [Candidatus Bathyarchaeota archaeon]